MVPLLSTRRAEIDELCRRFHVRRLDVFGSAAREHDFTDSSDIDLLVEYEPDHHPPSLDDYFDLRDALENLLARKVDLIMHDAVRNPYVRAGIQSSRQNLHGS